MCFGPGVYLLQVMRDSACFCCSEDVCEIRGVCLVVSLPACWLFLRLTVLIVCLSQPCQGCSMRQLQLDSIGPVPRLFVTVCVGPLNLCLCAP
jgi:hypothetical protein